MLLRFVFVIIWFSPHPHLTLDYEFQKGGSVSLVTFLFPCLSQCQSHGRYLILLSEQWSGDLLSDKEDWLINEKVLDLKTRILQRKAVRYYFIPIRLAKI